MATREENRADINKRLRILQEQTDALSKLTAKLPTSSNNPDAGSKEAEKSPARTEEQYDREEKEMMNSMQDAIRDIRDKLLQIQQSNNESMKEILRA